MFNRHTKRKNFSSRKRKKYLKVETWDYDQPDKYDNDFSLSVSKTKEEIERSKSGEKVDRIFIGNGRIWEQNPKTREIKPEEIESDDDLPF